MFELEESIAQWRRQMLAAGINFPVPLEELESHLRDAVDRQMRSGQSAQEAFAAAVAQMGHAPALKDEFKKTQGADLLGQHRMASLGHAVSVGLFTTIPPGVATLRKYASLPYLAAVLCFYLPFREVSDGRLSTTATGQKIVYGGEVKWYDAPTGGVVPGHHNANIIAIWALVFAFAALLLSLFRRPTARQLSGLVGLGAASAVYLIKADSEIGAGFRFFGPVGLQMREGYWLAMLCLVPGAALQFTLVKWEQVANCQNEGKPWLPKKKSRRRILIQLLAGLALSLLPVGLWLFVSPDAPPSDVSDLAAAPRNLPNDQNAFEIVMQAAGLVKTDSLTAVGDKFDDLAEGKNWDAALARQLLDGTDAIWPLWEKAARTPQSQAPLVIHVPGPILKLSKLADIRAWDLARQGQPDAAIESLFTTLQVGQRLEQSRGDLICYYTGSGVRFGALSSLRGITAEFKPSAAILRQTLRQVEASRPDKDAFAYVLRGEFSVLSRELETVERTGTMGPGDYDEETRLVFRIGTHVPYFFHPNQTRQIYAEATRGWIGGIDQKAGYPGDLRKTENISKLLETTSSGNWFGRALLAVTVSFGGNLLDNRLKEQSTVSANEAFLALLLYHRDHGEMPATLDALVPDYLPAVPRDYFDGQPIRYSRDFRAVWSVGTEHFTVTRADQGPPKFSNDIYLPLDFAASAVSRPETRP